MAVETPATDRNWVLDDDQNLLELLQGLWTEQQYLRLTDYSNRMIEYTDGSLEVLPMPTDKHQAIIGLLFLLLTQALAGHGVVRVAGLKIRLREGKFRDPDLLLVLQRADSRRGNDYWYGADLVVEVVSPN